MSNDEVFVSSSDNQLQLIVQNHKPIIARTTILVYPNAITCQFFRLRKDYEQS